jgi:hypothetical protein
MWTSRRLRKEEEEEEEEEGGEAGGKQAKLQIVVLLLWREMNRDVLIGACLSIFIVKHKTKFLM